MKCNCKFNWNIVIAILLIVLLWVNIFALTKQSDDAWGIEIMKIWWKENWKMIEKIYESDYYISQQTQAIEATLQQFKQESEIADSTSSYTDADIADIVEDILATSTINGDKDARFTILEYTELLCPYCQRQALNGTVQSVLDKYPGEVNSVIRHYIIHGEDALNLAAGIECIGEINPDLYYDAIHKAFEAYPANMDILMNIATSLGVKEADLQTCIDNGAHKQSVEDMMNQWYQVFGIRGTPWYIVIDRESGKHQTFPWTYPADELIKAVESLKNS